MSEISHWRQGLDHWEKLCREETMTQSRKTTFARASGHGLSLLYTPLDVDDATLPEHLGFPGQFPYTRGIHQGMYRTRLWTMRQYAGFGMPSDTNRRFKYLLDKGETGLSVAFDLCTQLGLDSDNPLSAGEVGRLGVAIDTVDDMAALFDGIPLDRVSTSMTINAPAAVLFAMYLTVAESQGVSFSNLRGTVQNDILKEYLARGTYIFPPEPSMRLVRDLVIYSVNHVPKWNPISVSGYHMREAGCTAVQELAFTLANALAYVEAVLRDGLEVDLFSPKISFFFAVHNRILEEIAKFRAARRLWASLMRDRYHPSNPASEKLRFHAQTGGITLTAQQPWNNIVRVAIQALAAVLGGVQSLHTNSWDEAIGLPSEEAARLALRTQQIIAYESGVADTVDPLGGSYLIEHLTRTLEREARRIIERVLELGGMPEAIAVGYPQREIQKAAYRCQCAVEHGEECVVGLNCFKEESEAPRHLPVINPKAEKQQIERLRRVRERRDRRRVQKALDDIHQAAETEENLMPVILDAVRAFASVGEICDQLRAVMGQYRENTEL